MTNHGWLGWVALLTVILLGLLYAAAHGDVKAIPIPSPAWQVGQPAPFTPPTQPNRKPDKALVIDECVSGESLAVLEWDGEELGFVYRLDAKGNADERPIVILHWDAKGQADHIWFKGREWGRDEFMATYNRPCDMLER